MIEKFIRVKEVEGAKRNFLLPAREILSVSCPQFETHTPGASTVAFRCYDGTFGHFRTVETFTDLAKLLSENA